MKRKEWNLQALAIAAANDLKDCHNDHERLMANTINRKEMRELWQKMKSEGRKASPLDIAIAEQWGLE